MIDATELPPESLLLPYRGAGYTDCYATTLPFPVTAAAFIEGFYTTPLFRLERMLLGLVLRRPSTDAEAHALAVGHRDAFAAWSVEARRKDQIVLAAGRTRSWLAVRPDPSLGTRLYFGSAVVPQRAASGKQAMGFWFRALGGFHKIYARALLRAARNRLLAQSSEAPASAP